MKMRPLCFLRPILRPAAVFALAFGLSSMMLSAQDEAAAGADSASAASASTENTSESAQHDAAADQSTPDTLGSLESSSAAETAEPLAALTADEQDVTAATEEDMIQEESKFNEFLSQAITRRGEKEFAEAFKLFDQAQAVVDACEVSPAKAVFASRLDKERKIAQVLYGDLLLEQCEQAYNKLLQLNHTDEIVTIGTQLLTDLAHANAVYYLGKLPGEAIDAKDLRRAVARDPQKGQFAKTVQTMSASTQEMIDGQKFYGETNLDSLDQRYNERQKEINLLYRAGETLFQSEQYAESRDKMEQILVKDPYNEKAITLLDKIYRKLYAIADMRIYNEFLKEQAQTDWNWIESIPDVRNVVIMNGPEAYESAGNELYDRLKSLLVDHIEFNEADVVSAIALLRARSKDIDPKGEGVNLIVTQQEKHANKYVTLNLDQVPLYEVIRYICKITGLSFRINEADKTLIIGAGSDVNDMVRRYIPIRQGIINRIVSNMGTEATDGITYEAAANTVDASFANVDMSNTFTTGVAGTEAMNRVTAITSDALRKYFTENGIPFEEGSFIAYDARANKLTVVNTPENVRQLELAIRDMDVQNPLILIESKMVEIKMNDLEELGFDWTLSHGNGEDDHWNFTFTSPTIDSGFFNNKLVNNLNLVPNFGPGGTWSLFLTINAVDRTDRAEILATPKVVTTSGRQAQMQMVRQMYFPEEWSEPDITTSCGSSVSFEPSYPEFGPARDIGTSLTVTPTLYSNNYTIRLELNPSVTDLTGWSDYSYNYVIGDFASGEEYPMTLKMPEISVRSVETTIKVYDGQTVIIGGILSDSQGSLSDKWPIYGDIPLLGRFFTESATEVHKDNLIISVSTRLISGDGIPVRTNTQNGLPDFRR